MPVPTAAKSKSERIAEASYKLSRTWGIPPAAPAQQVNNNAGFGPAQQRADPAPRRPSVRRRRR